MPELIECIPNFSEGRDPATVAEIVEAITSVDGVRLLNYSLNPDHNRAVVTFVGSPSAVVEAAFRGVARAVELIDLRRHTGEHPRIGAADVVPFVPLGGARMETCIALARQLGRRIGDKLGVPVYLYEAAATRAGFRNLAQVRRGQFEGLVAHGELAGDRVPDFGPDHVHPSAGAVAVGARWPLLAYNISLNTRDVLVAQEIARAVRYQTGGLRNVKALGVSDGGRAEVTMNLVNPRQTPPHVVFALVRELAERYGASVNSSEIIGLAPLDALLAAAEHHLRLAGFRREQILEWQLLAELQPSNAVSDAEEPDVASLTGYLDALASSQPTPGGGSVAALVGALAAALGEMVANLTVGRAKFADVEDRMYALRDELTHRRRRLVAAMQEDAEAFEAYMAARRLPRGTDVERRQRQAALAQATIAAARAPLAVARLSSELLPLLGDLAELGNPSVASDAGVGAILAEGAVRASAINVMVNLPGITDETLRRALGDEVATLEQEARRAAADVVTRVQAVITGSSG